MTDLQEMLSVVAEFKPRFAEEGIDDMVDIRITKRSSGYTASYITGHTGRGASIREALEDLLRVL